MPRAAERAGHRGAAHGRSGRPSGGPAGIRVTGTLGLAPLMVMRAWGLMREDPAEEVRAAYPDARADEGWAAAAADGPARGWAQRFRDPSLSVGRRAPSTVKARSGPSRRSSLSPLDLAQRA